MCDCNVEVTLLVLTKKRDITFNVDKILLS